MAKIELKGLGHAYNMIDGQPDYALFPMDMTWEDGGTYALLGPSGCGKSTMLNIVSGLLKPSIGQVFVDGKDVTDLGARKRNIAQVFQFPVVYRSKTVFENLAFPLRCARIERAVIDRRVNEVAQLLNLETVLQKPANALTPDLKQLISLGRGLVRDDVAVILMDEPLTVIDPQLKFSLRRKLRDISARNGHTLVYVTHDQNEAMTLAEQVVVMDNGKIIQVGTPQELFENPQHEHVGYFIGTPSMNFVPGRVEKGIVRVLEVPVGKLSGTSIQNGQEIKVGIRPEFVHLVKTSDERSFVARVIDVQDLGGSAVVNASLVNASSADDVSIKIKLHHDVPEIGTECHVRFEPEMVRFYDNGVVVR